MTDRIDEVFGNLDQFYPGSKRKRRAWTEADEARVAKSNESWESNPKVKRLPNGKEVELFSAGSFAQALGRPLVTVRLWERRGFIPRAPYRLKPVVVAGVSKPGWRMYSRAMIESTLESFRSRGLLEASRIDWEKHRDLSIELIENWSRIHAEETN